MDSYNPSGLTQEEINKLYDNDIETFTVKMMFLKSVKYVQWNKNLMTERRN